MTNEFDKEISLTLYVSGVNVTDICQVFLVPPTVTNLICAEVHQVNRKRKWNYQYKFKYEKGPKEFKRFCKELKRWYKEEALIRNAYGDQFLY